MLMKLSVAFMIKGEMPRENTLPSTFPSSRMQLFLIFREDLLPIRNDTTQAALSPWEITVATAAPFTPMPSPKMNTGSRMMFATAPISTESMAVLGWLWQMIKAFSPRAISTNSVPAR